MAETRERWRAQLPHWEVRDRPHFVTIRCAGSLPEEVRLRLGEIQQTLQTVEPHSPGFAQLQRRYFLACEKYLDAGSGFAPFATPELGELWQETLQSIEPDCGWAVPHWVAMPNHVHFLMAPAGADPLPLRKAVARLKGRFARRANSLLQRTGEFWQSEWFDHWCRDAPETARIIEYIRQNPVKAGLATTWEQYPWVQ